MKFMVSDMAYFLRERQARRNLRALAKYLVFMFAVIAAYSVIFHFIMKLEGEKHSWITGFYWTLTVMSTLGFGDITFHTDLGRLFSIVVLLSGVVLLMIMLPFAFIRYFYAPWLEAQIRLRAPRQVPDDAADHVIICRYDSIAPGLIQKLEFNHIPYFVIEPDAVVAGQMSGEGISVVSGQVDSQTTYERLRVPSARMVFANAEDTLNTNITLTVREVDAEVPICALAEDEDSIDILELSGATRVLALKRQLGEHLAARVTAGTNPAHVVGTLRDLQIAEFTVHGTALDGQTLRQARLRELTGVNIVGVWEQGKLQPALPDSRFTSFSVPVAVGSRQQVDQLNHLLAGPAAISQTVLVIGGGKVGMAAAAALHRRGLTVRIVEKNPSLEKGLRVAGCQPVIGDAADRNVLREAGLEDAGAAVLTTNSDAVNIHLTVYCRRLKPNLNVVTRLTHQRNIESIYRAGANSALSYSSLGREHVISMLLQREPVMVGEGADFFLAPLPDSLAGKTLGDSRIGAHTQLIVIGIENGTETITNPAPSTPLVAGSKLLMLGTPKQRQVFASAFE